MKLQQLKYLCDIVDEGFNVTRTSVRFHTSQPGISRHVRLLEEELGARIFVRNKKRLTGLTPIGHSVVDSARKIVGETENLRNRVHEHLSSDVGHLRIATSYLLARYSLLPVIKRFRARYPKVRLSLKQGAFSQITRWVALGEADILLSTTPAVKSPEITFLPCHEFHPIVLTPAKHPLLQQKAPISLRELARYPLITYVEEFSARAHILRAFQDEKLEPNIVVSATDADTMKAYVAALFGVAIVSHTSFDPKSDRKLRAIDASHLFPSSIVRIGLRRNVHIASYLLHFIELFSPQLNHSRVMRAVSPDDQI